MPQSQYADACKELERLLPPQMMGACTHVEAQKGLRLFSAGHQPQYMFFVATGEVVLERPGLQGDLVILQRTRRGFVSEASLNSPHYHCHGHVVAPSRIIQVPVHEVRKALSSDLAFSGRWIGMLNTEVKRLRQQCERLSLTRVQDRLIHLLETEGKNGCFPVGAGIKSMASQLGVTHEALYRCIHAMEKKGALSRSDGLLRLSAAS